MGEFRMPPGQRPSVRLYPISVLGKPKDVNIEKYVVRITGLVSSFSVGLAMNTLSGVLFQQTIQRTLE